MRPTSAIGERRGFTLVELMVVLAILALLAASLPVALNRLLPAGRTASAADRLMADIRLLQSEALNTGTPARMVLTDSGYRLDAAGQRAATEVKLPESTILRFRAREDDRELSELIVYPDGTASPGRFEIADSGRQAFVEIAMLTGSARRSR
jgi:general secretion pathway protein H